MTGTRVLAAAAERLRDVPGFPRRPGRPRKARPEAQPSKVLAASTIAAVLTRLLDLAATAAYLGVSGWTVRDLAASGVLKRVRVPLQNGGELRKLLFDRADLDDLISRWKS